MTKSKSPRKSSPLALGASINTSNQTKHSIAAAGAALQAATATHDSRASPPPSPRQLKHNKDVGSTPKEVKKGVAAVETMNYTRERNIGSAHGSLGNGVEKSFFVQDKKTVSLQETSADIAASIDANDHSVGQDWKLARLFPSYSSTSTSPSSIPLVSGSGSGNGGDCGANSSARTILSPPALSYRGYNPFERIQQDHIPSMDNRQTSHEINSSDSSDDSYMDEDDGGDSSDSSNSSHASEDEDSSEEEQEDDDDDDDDDESEEDEDETDMSIDHLSAAQKAGRRKQQHHQQRTGSPLLRRTLHRKHIQRIREEQHQSHPSQLSPPKGTSSTAPFNHFDPSTTGIGSEKEGVVLLADETAKAKWHNWSVRTLWTLIMIGGFFACVAAGPAFVILLVVMVQGLVYKEVIYLANVPSKEKKLPWFRSMNWYFLFSTNYFFYGESLIQYFQHVVFVDAFLLPFATHHRFISFTLYVIGFVFFVANLKKGHYRFQFSQFAWTHMTLLLVVCQSHFIINNIFEGLIWFFLPASLVIANDIWAYIFGFFWGKTPLIKLSPKKTVEGFVGGWIMTIFFGMLFATLFLQYPYMICPVKDLRATAFSGLTCEPNPVFVPVKYYLKPWMYGLIRHLGMRNNYVMIAPLQLHTIFMACFASLIAPFGGFFASGFKRAFKIKDFGQSIPGHGGITDRMDCQFLMGLFSYMYYQSFIKTSAISVGVVLQSAIHNLKGHEQMELFDHMRQYLIGQGLLDQDSCVIIPPKEAWIS